MTTVYAAACMFFSFSIDHTGLFSISLKDIELLLACFNFNNAIEGPVRWTVGPSWRADG